MMKEDSRRPKQTILDIKAKRKSPQRLFVGIADDD